MIAEGTYYYTFATQVYPRVVLTPFKMRVAILNETKTQYYIRYLEAHQNGAKAGKETYVSKSKVRADYHKRGEAIRLPYKD